MSLLTFLGLWLLTFGVFFLLRLEVKDFYV